jgi:hypothetical protein
MVEPKSILDSGPKICRKVRMVLSQDEQIDDRITANQKSYLNLLATTIQHDQIRKDLLKRMNLLSRYKASKIIETLLAGDAEEITRFF